MQRELEALVDSSSLESVLNHLVGICNLKAEHLRENWQDESTAILWDRSARMIEKTADKLPIHPSIRSGGI